MDSTHWQRAGWITLGAVYTAILLLIGDRSVPTQAIIATLPSVPILALIQQRDLPRKVGVSAKIIAAGIASQLVGMVAVLLYGGTGFQIPFVFAAVYATCIAICIFAFRGAWATAT